MAGVKALRKIQLGRESSAGSEVAATTVWRGQGVLKDNRVIARPDEDIGYISPYNRTYTPKTEGAISFVDTEATFEQVPILFEAGIDTVTGTQDGAGTDYIYDYTMDTTSQSLAIKTYTIEAGDNQQEEQMLYCFIQKFTIGGVAGEALMMSADWVGRAVAPGTYTGSVAVPTVEEILFSKGKLYLDAVSGSYGGTQITNTLLAASIEVETGIIPKYTADGSLNFSFIQYTRPKVTVNVTFEHNSSAVTEKANWRAETPQLMQLKFEGSTVATPGSTYSVKTFIANIAGSWDSFDALSDQDGNDIVTGVFAGGFDATDATFAEFIVVNELSALT